MQVGLHKLDNESQLPIWIRLPRSGERCIYTGLSRSALNELILPSEQNQKPLVASISLKKAHEVRGIRLIKLQSLLEVLDGLIERHPSSEKEKGRKQIPANSV